VHDDWGAHSASEVHYICLSIVYLFVCVVSIVYKIMSEDTITRYWLPECHQKNHSNDLALLFSLLGAQLLTDSLDF
jgi:hypothetical protein